MGSSSKSRVVFIGVMAALFLVVLGGIWGLRNFGKTDRAVSAESATRSLDNLYKRVDPEIVKPSKVAVEVDDMLDEGAELPDIDNYKVTVDGGAGAVEIWSSGEKANDGTDGWMRELAVSYNQSHDSKVTLRSVPSGVAVDYMVSGKAKPAGYSPSNMLWVNLLKSSGVDTNVITERTVGNLAGIAIKKSAAKRLSEAYGSVDLASIVDGVVAGDVVIGYTNPNTSAAGLNLLASVLDRFGDGNPTSDAATDKFVEFQSNVPFVAMTTQQMRDAAQRGSLDGFVTELQVYNLDDNMKGGYEFVPFGWRHDNPLVAVGGASSEAQQMLADFAKWCEDNGGETAKAYGFNDKDSYKMDATMPDGSTLKQELAMFKENKDAGVPVVAVFVCDVSGSMDGTPIQSLKESLVNSMRYIGTSNYVGMVSFADDVKIQLPIDRFDMNQQALFKGAVVKGLVPGGSTATVDGLVVGAKMVADKVAELGEAKPMLFLLSDGRQNRGFGMNDIRGPLESLGIPVYSIAYGDDCDMSALESLSSINEAAVVSASTDDISYQLKNLFNANV